MQGTLDRKTLTLAPGADVNPDLALIERVTAFDAQVLDPPSRKAADRLEAAMAGESMAAARVEEPMGAARMEESVAATMAEEPGKAAVARAARIPVVEHSSRIISSKGGLHA